MRRRLVFPTLALAAAAAHPTSLRGQATPAARGGDRAAGLADSVARTQTEAGLRRAIVFRREAAVLYRGEARLRDAGQMLHLIGRTYRALGHPDSALDAHREALAARREAGDRRGEGASLGSIGLAHADAGRPDSAVAYYRRARAIQQAGGSAERGAVATTLTNIGAAYTTLGHLDLALRHHRQALAVRRELADRTGQLAALNNVGAVHAMLGRPDSAAHYYARALELAREARDPAAEGTALGNLGAVQMDRGRADSAAAYFRAALALQRGLNDRGAVVTTLGNLASAFLELRHTDSAQHYFQDALAAARDARNRLAEGRATGNLGALHAALGRRDSALHCFERAVALARAVDDPFGVAETLASVAQLYLSRPGRTPDDVARARAYLDSAAAVYAATRSRAGQDADAVAFAEKNRELFSTWALAWLARVDASDGDVGARAALAVADRGRARALLDQIRSSSAGGRRGAAADPQARPGADLAAEADSLLAPLRRARTAVLSYLVTGDTLVTWLALPTAPLRVTRAALRRDSLDALVRALHGEFAAPAMGATASRARAAAALRALEPGATPAPTGSAAAAAAALERLGALLVPATLRRELPAAGDLVVVPHGALALVPFAALPAGASGDPLGVRYAVRVEPSLAALAAAQARPARLAAGAGPNGVDGRRRALRAALVVGDPSMPELPGTGERLDPLPAARREARWVAGRLGVRALTGEDATESVVAAALARAPLIHLATHGLAYGSDARARDSFVALAPDSLSDGLLTVAEVLDDPALALTADLVVLSACQTGSGVLWQSEGTVGLSRAFLARGARSVLVSLWSVSDDATELLMRRLYTHWLDDADRPSVAEALRRAQGDVRRTTRFAHPRYWAAFQLVGAR